MEGNPPLPPPRGVGSKSKIGRSTHSSDASLKNNQGMDLKWIVSFFRKFENFIDDFNRIFNEFPIAKGLSHQIGSK
jgi:hypothetical protein